MVRNLSVQVPGQDLTDEQRAYFSEGYRARRLEAFQRTVDGADTLSGPKGSFFPFPASEVAAS